jgi:hypothetical protein
MAAEDRPVAGVGGGGGGGRRGKVKGKEEREVHRLEEGRTTYACWKGPMRSAMERISSTSLGLSMLATKK